MNKVHDEWQPSFKFAIASIIFLCAALITSAGWLNAIFICGAFLCHGWTYGFSKKIKSIKQLK